MKTWPIIVLCVLALFCILVLAMLLFFFYKNSERIARSEIEYARMEKEREEARLKLREVYRSKYLEYLKGTFENDKLKDEEKNTSRTKYVEILEKLSETN